MKELTFEDIQAVWDEMEKLSWEDFRTILENHKHKPEGIEHDDESVAPLEGVVVRGTAIGHPGASGIHAA